MWNGPWGHGWEEGSGLDLSLYLSLYLFWGVSFKVTCSCVQSGMVAKDCRKQIIIDSGVITGLPVLTWTAILVWLTHPSFFQSFSALNEITSAQEL